jgi:hypothetical protein
MKTSMRPFVRTFAGHPRRIAAASGLLVLGLAAFWYLASPLWIRTTRNEALPTARAAPTATATSAATATPAAPVTLRRGELQYVDNIHNGKGPVLLVDVGGTRYVRFEDVMITNAPDIHIYLSRDSGGRYVDANTLYLGPLKATNGSFNYEVPSNVDPAQFRSVVVWCRAFATLITWADLR